MNLLGNTTRFFGLNYKKVGKNGPFDKIFQATLFNDLLKREGRCLFLIAGPGRGGSL